MMTDMGEGQHLGDAVVDLALGHVVGRERAVMASHLLQCPACRREYDELAAAISELGPGVPAVQPPLGFDERVVQRIVARDGANAPRPYHRWTRWARWAGAAAVAAIAVTAAALVGREIGLDDRPAAPAASAGTVATLRLADGGTPVGTVSLADVDGRPVMVVAVVDAPADVSYTCRTRFADGSVVDSESWPAAASGAWVVPLPAGGSPVASVELVATGTDYVWSTADL